MTTIVFLFILAAMVGIIVAALAPFVLAEGILVF